MTVEYYPERDDLYWHALNFRCAAGQHAELMWQELAACHERLVAAAVERSKNSHALSLDKPR